MQLAVSDWLHIAGALTDMDAEDQGLLLPILCTQEHVHQMCTDRNHVCVVLFMLRGFLLRIISFSRHVPMCCRHTA